MKNLNLIAISLVMVSGASYASDLDCTTAFGSHKPLLSMFNESRDPAVIRNMLNYINPGFENPYCLKQYINGKYHQAKISTGDYIYRATTHFIGTADGNNSIAFDFSYKKKDGTDPDYETNQHNYYESGVECKFRY
jgi:hypothetical protein